MPLRVFVIPTPVFAPYYIMPFQVSTIPLSPVAHPSPEAHMNTVYMVALTESTNAEGGMSISPGSSG